MRMVCQIAAFFMISSSIALAQRPPATLPARNHDLPTLWIIGDSTVRNGQDTGDNGQWGWGNPLSRFFDTTKINVVNWALGGTSSRTYQTMGRWQQVLDVMQPGDFVILQFGTNDGGVIDDPSRARGTLPGNGEETREIDNPVTKKREVVHTFGWYIRKYVTDARSKEAAEVIICSLIPRNHWAGGKVDSQQPYPLWSEEAAKQTGALYIDLHRRIADKYEAVGQQEVTDDYFPVDQTTHPDWAGAVLNAQCVVDGMKALDQCKLVKYLLPNPPAEIPLPMGKAR
jgi:rhamnogalacturonan acetylesterase